MEQKLRKEYLKALSRSPKSSHLKLLKKAKAGLLQQKIHLELTKGVAQKLKKHSVKNELTPDAMANKIVSEWLKRR